MLVGKLCFIKDDLFSVQSSPSRADESQGLVVLKVWLQGSPVWGIRASTSAPVCPYPG